MADDESSGTTAATKGLIAVLLVPVVIVLAFFVVGSLHSSTKAAMPALQTKGLKWAQARAKTAGFDNTKTHDALGRDRGTGDTKSWVVCFQEPAPTKQYSAQTVIEFGVVRVTETCPATDQGRIGRAGLQMPDFLNRTAYMANVSLGDDASVRYLDATKRSDDDNGVDHDLGNYRVCSQMPAAGAAWDGVPVTLAVLPYEQDCNNPKLEDEHAKKMPAADLFHRVIAAALNKD